MIALFSHVCRCCLPQSNKVSRFNFFFFFAKIAHSIQNFNKNQRYKSKESISKLPTHEPWSQERKHMPRNTPKRRNGFVSSLITPSIPVVSVALRLRLAAFRISHIFFLISMLGIPNLSNPHFTARCNKSTACLSESCSPLWFAQCNRKSEILGRKNPKLPESAFFVRSLIFVLHVLAVWPGLPTSTCLRPWDINKRETF